MLRLFLSNQLLVLLLIPMIVAGYLGINYSTNYFSTSDFIDLGFWGSLKISTFVGDYLPFVSGIAVTGNSYLINYFFNSNDFYDKNSYVIALLYVILLSYFRSFYFLDGLLISNTFILLAFIQFFKLETNADGKRNVFNASFFLGVATTFHPPLVFVLPFSWVITTRIRPFVFRELLLSIFGMSVPLLYAVSYNFIYKNVINFNFIETTETYQSKEIIFFTALGLFVLLLSVSWFGIRNKAAKSSIRFRKHTSMLSIFLLFSIGLGAIDWIFFQQYEWFCFAVLPISLFLPFSFLSIQARFGPFLLFYIAFLFSVIKFFIYSF